MASRAFHALLIFPHQLHVQGVHATAVEGEHGFDDLGHARVRRKGGLPVEAEGLLGDFGDAGELVGRHLRVLERFGIERLVLTEQVEEIGDGLERIVDLVRD
jgi:hypothetical protein